MKIAWPLLCFDRCLVIAKAKIEKDKNYNTIRQGRNIQTRKAKELRTNVRICEEELIGIQEISAYEELLKYQINIVCVENNNEIIYPSKDDIDLGKTQVYLWKQKNHYDLF